MPYLILPAYHLRPIPAAQTSTLGCWNGSSITGYDSTSSSQRRQGIAGKEAGLAHVPRATDTESHVALM
jgi:hypothetical protein